jgi:hypothetical protein
MDRGFDQAVFFDFFERQQRIVSTLPYNVMNEELQHRATTVMKTASRAVRNNASLSPLRNSIASHNKAGASQQNRLAIVVYATLAQCENSEAFPSLDLTGQATVIPEHMIDSSDNRFAKSSILLIRFEILLTRDNDCERQDFAVPDYDLYVQADEDELVRKTSRKFGLPQEVVHATKEAMKRCSPDELRQFYDETLHMSMDDVLSKSLSMMYVCALCGRYSEIMSKCGRCLGVRYCNAECQKLHWKEHKNWCKAHAK